jgi:ornithine cyclodeaminase/alanine dehydrogenase-like protein (mu-crystallin family)
MMRLLTRSDVRQSISMREAMEVVKRAFIDLSTGRADVPLRIALSQPKHDGITLFMFFPVFPVLPVVLFSQHRLKLR